MGGLWIAEYHETPVSQERSQIGVQTLTTDFWECVSGEASTTHTRHNGVELL